MKASAFKPIALAGAATVFCLAACLKAPDLSAARAIELQSVRRYDTVQAIAANDRVVVAGTQDGAVLISHDNARTWTRHSLGDVSLLGLASCPDGSFVGIDFYHRVWSADAGGEGWTPHPIAKPRTALTITCDARGLWWVGGTQATLASSADHGALWQVMDLGKDAQIMVIAFSSANVGLGLGEFGTTVRTADGGRHWSIGPSIPNDFYPYSAVFASERVGWVSGLAGQVLVTHDAGLSWTAQRNETHQTLYRLFAHQGRIYGAGAGGQLARLEGDVWREFAYPDRSPVSIGAATGVAHSDTLVLGGQSGLLRAIDTRMN